MGIRHALPLAIAVTNFSYAFANNSTASESTHQGHTRLK